LNAKSRKETEKNIQEIAKEYASVDIDSDKYLGQVRANKEMNETKSQIDILKSSLYEQVKDECNKLCEYGILCEKENGYDITEKGIPVLYTAEIDPIIAFKMIEKTQWFSKYNAVDFAKLFSCFTNIKVDDEFRRPIPVDSLLDEFSVDNPDLHYDLYEDLEKWCEFETEIDCKIFIQNALAEKGISIGDFTKAVLKIATISREWASICEICGHTDVQNELVKVENLVLKYITTSQSLYI
jgi:hypothetical protein